MCGRAKLPDDVSEIKLDLKIDFDEIGDYRPRWNAAPTSKLPVVISSHGERTLTAMRWGLDPVLGQGHQDRLFDLQRPRRRHRYTPGLPRRLAGRPPLPRHRRRLLRVARRRQTTLRCGARQSRADDLCRPVGPLARAATASRSNPSPSSPRRPTTCSSRCTIACRSCCAPDRWAAWLGEHRGHRARKLKAMLKPYPGAAMAFWPVDRRVGNVRNDTPDLFAPIERTGSRPRRVISNGGQDDYDQAGVDVRHHTGPMRGVAPLARCPISSSACRKQGLPARRRTRRGDRQETRDTASLRNISVSAVVLVSNERGRKIRNGPEDGREEILRPSTSPLRELMGKRDFYAGGLMILLGLGIALKGTSYRAGTLMHMGPGFLPTALGVLLVLLGIAIAAAASSPSAGGDARREHPAGKSAMVGLVLHPRRARCSSSSSDVTSAWSREHSPASSSPRSVTAMRRG